MFQPFFRKNNLFTFIVYQFHLQHTAIAIEITYFYRMQSGFQSFLHDNLCRRMCAVVISQQFTVKYQRAAVVREKGKCINAVSRNLQIAGQYQTNVALHSFGDRYRFYDVLFLYGSSVNIRTEISAEVVPYSFQSGL